MTQLQSFGRPLVMIGCGNMAGAILSRWLQCGLDPAQVTVVDPHRAEIQAGVTLLAALPARLPDDAVVVLGVKPQLLPEVTPVLAPLLGSGNLVISMLAGVTVDQLRLSLGAAPGLRGGRRCRRGRRGRRWRWARGFARSMSMPGLREAGNLPRRRCWRRWAFPNGSRQKTLLIW